MVTMVRTSNRVVSHGTATSSRSCCCRRGWQNKLPLPNAAHIHLVTKLPQYLVIRLADTIPINNGYLAAALPLALGDDSSGHSLVSQHKARTQDKTASKPVKIPETAATANISHTAFCHR